MKNLQEVEISLDATEAENSENINTPNPEIFPDTKEKETTVRPSNGEASLVEVTLNRTRLTTAAASGITGSFGLLGQAIDLPLFYANAALQVARLARIYGFDPSQAEEKDFIKKLIIAGHLPTEDARNKELAEIHSSTHVNTYAAEIGSLLASRGSTISIYKLASKAFASRFRYLLPVVGAAANVAANLRLMEAIMDTAMKGYSRRSDLLKQLNETGE